MQASPARTNRWILGARLPTLPAAIVPVIVGTAAAGSPLRVDRFVLAAIVSLALQIGVNFANDYSDGIRGTDRYRTGPPRLVASGLATPAEVLRAALVAFAIAALAGTILALGVAPWLIAVGLASIVAAWLYTGGPRPYGYAGMGEVMVFVFFGLVGTLGSTFVQRGSLTPTSWYAAVAVGALTTALLVVNNLRDIPGDARSGKRTLAVIVGDRTTRALYVALLVAGALATIPIAWLHPWAWLTEFACVLAVRPIRTICAGASGRDLIPALVDTGRLELVFGVVLGTTLLIAGANAP